EREQRRSHPEADRQRRDEEQAVLDRERGGRVPRTSSERAKRRELISAAATPEIQGQAEREGCEHRTRDAGGELHTEREALRAGSEQGLDAGCPRDPEDLHP